MQIYTFCPFSYTTFSQDMLYYLSELSYNRWDIVTFHALASYLGIKTVQNPLLWLGYEK